MDVRCGQMRMDARRDAQRIVEPIRKLATKQTPHLAQPASTSPRTGRRPEGRAISGRFVVARPLNPVPEGATPGKVLDLAADSAPGGPHLWGQDLSSIDLEIDPSHAHATCPEAP